MIGHVRPWLVPASVLFILGCNEGGPTAPGRSDLEGAVELLACQADLQSNEISCSSAEGAMGEGAPGLLIGGQGVYVQLAASNVGYDSGTDTFSADVTIRNLSNQVLGSTDGISTDTSGVQIFFVGEPRTTGGSGGVRVSNADGHADFSAADQLYFQYLQAIAPGRTSLPRTWEWEVPNTVRSFSFMVGVSAGLPDSDRLEPGLGFLAETISADSLHNCVLDFTGQAWCWGGGGRGRLGNGSEDDQPRPVAVEQGSLRFVSITTGLSHSCALADTGAAYCWGNGASGRIGNGSSINVNTTPQLVSGGHEFIQIDGGRQFTCAVTSAGAAYCWGYNANGQLGDGTLELSNVPVAVGGGHTFRVVAAGGFHACGIATDGRTYCWGSQTNGKQGNGKTSGNALEPSLVLGGHDFVSIAAGNQHTCALTGSGEAYCWGSQANGKIGNGLTAGSTAIPEPFRVLTDERFSSLDATYNHTCGVALDGKGYCWGSNARGKLGIGTTGSQAVPTRVANVENFASIAIGADHGCGLTTGSEVYCWGNAGDGRLGTGSSVNLDVPVRAFELRSPFGGTPALIESVTPSILRPGEEAQIRGSGFSPVASGNRVRVHGAIADVRSSSDTLLVVGLPTVIPPLAGFECGGPPRGVRITVDVEGGRRSVYHPLDPTRTLELGVGEDHFLTGGEASCLEIRGEGSEYLVGVFSTSTTAASISAYQLLGRSADGADPAPRPLVSSAPVRLEPAPMTEEMLHYQHLEEDRRLYEELGPLPTRVRASAMPRGASAAPAPAIGSLMDIRIRRKGGAGACVDFDTIETRVAYVGPRLMVLEDTDGRIAGTMDDVFREVGEEFERDMLPILEEYYGDPFLLDQELGSDGRIRMVVTPIVNSEGLLGFVTNANLRPRSQCEGSNMAATMYVRAATGVGSLTPDGWAHTTRATVIHEAKHIISHAYHLSQGAPSFEVSWLEEGTARISEELWARSVYGFGQGENVDHRTGLYCGDPRGQPGCTGSEPRVMHKHFGQLNSYLQATANRSPLGRANSSDGSFYGSAWSLVRWAIDHSGKPERDFLRALTQEPTLNGIANLEARAERSFSEMIGYWSFANFLDDYPGLVTRDELQQPSWNLREVFGELHRVFPGSYRNEFPIVPREVPLGAFDFEVGELRGGGIDFTILTGSAGAPQYLQLRGEAGGPPASTLNLGIVRLR